MSLKTLIMTAAVVSAIAAPAVAQDRERQRSNDNHPQQQADHARARQQPQADQKQPQQQQAQPQQAQPQQPAPLQARPQAQPQRQQAARQDQARRQEQAAPRSYSNNNTRGYDTHNSNNSNNGHYDNHGSNYNGHYDAHAYVYRRYSPRVIRPEVVHIVPYQPYVYRPSFSIGVYYGTDGYYPYGYTPQSYYQPLPGHAYGGVRITGAPRDAQVFADGYYVGLVDDFDGIFQHVNLEAGPHHVEVAWNNSQPIAFDVYVRPGETTTFRADGYFRY